MHINQIQSSQITRTKQPNFKATFINDAKGYFQEIWLGASKTRDLMESAKRFHNFLPEDQLEILGHKQHISPTGSCIGYDVFNHRTGNKAHYKAEPNMPFDKTLEFLLESIFYDRKVFETNFSSYIYEFLTKK